jgi:2-oxoglutarate dehydrogenase E1 component
MRADATDLAIARVEMLAPLPKEKIVDLIRSYPNLEKVYWVQEEPSNMGAWPFVSRPVGVARPYEITWDYIGRPRRASPSEGYAGSTALEQERIVTSALLTSPKLQQKTGRQPEIAGER